MRHFHHVPECDRQRLFELEPGHFDRSADLPTLALALGATLYMPATRPDLAQDLRSQAAAGVTSSVVCLEDAIADHELAPAQAHVVAQLRELARSADGEDGPLVFIRVRQPEQITQIVDELGADAGVLSGFVMPKFTDASGPAFLDALEQVNVTSGHRLLAMPVIESPEVIYRESRAETLLGIQELLAKHHDLVLAVRIGATDLSSPYGIRRDPDLTIYDVRLVAEVISDVVNILGRADGSGYVVTGPVWEYFHHERMFKPHLRQSPFDDQDARVLRRSLITKDLDRLIREIVLDKANGLNGKTVIHPTHVPAVHALSVVTYEEWSDASDILGGDVVGGGVRASSYRNKMNEFKPHRAWAERTIRRAGVFGVAAEDVSFVNLLGAGALA